MNQGKLEVVKQDIAKVNIDILGISELKWTGLGEFNSDDHYIYYCGEEFLERNGGALIVNKRAQNAVLGCNLKNYRMISVRFQGKRFNRVSILQFIILQFINTTIHKYYNSILQFINTTIHKYYNSIL